MIDETKKIHTKHGAVSANKLLQRTPGTDYLEEWTSLLAKEAQENQEQTERALLIFRLGGEWLGIEAKCLMEVSEERPVHSIPHSVNLNLKGVVNLKGQLRVCVDMFQLLEITPTAEKEEKNVLKYHRLLSIQKDGVVWAFEVDEVYGILHIDAREVENVPVTVSKSTANFLRGVIPWNDVSISYIDEELLFSALQRSVI